MEKTSDHQTPENAATFVKYEYDMFCNLAVLLQPGIPKMLLSQVIHYASLESFLIHTRNIVDFLCNKQDKQLRDDDIIAKYYIAQWQSNMDVFPYIKKHYDRLNKSVAHLSYERITWEIEHKKGKEGKEWQINTIYNEVELAWSKFWSQLGPKRDWFERDRDQVMFAIINASNEKVQ